MTHASPQMGRIYWHIRGCIKQHGRPPTVREIMRDLHLSSGSVTYNIDKLIAAGKLTRAGKYTARTLQLTGNAPRKNTPTLEAQATEWQAPGNVLRWDWSVSEQRFTGFAVIAADCGVALQVEASGK